MSVVATPAARHVVLAMTAAGVVYGSAVGLQMANDSRDGRHVENPLPKLGGWEAIAAWSFMFVFLVFLADVGPTGDLAKSFAYLFLLAIVFTYGIEAFANIQELMASPGGMPDTSMPGTIEPPDPTVGPI